MNEFTQHGLNRRDFLKLSGVSILGIIGSKFSYDRDELDLKSEIVHGVEVFGLQNRIDTQDKVDDLVAKFDIDFEEKLPRNLKGESVWKQREFLLQKDKRYAQFVVTESVYKKFLERKGETGVDYVEWLKLHIDFMNRVVGNIKPKCELETKISRIIIVSDNFQSNPVKYSKDIDGIWFNNLDYRVDQNNNTSQDTFWSAHRDVDGDLVFSFPAGGNTVYEEIRFDHKNDSFQYAPDGVWLDFSLVHELSHLIWNLPDEYVFDVKNSPYKFKNFIFGTGSFTRPYLSQYLAALIRLNVARGTRGYYTDPKGIGRSNVSLKEKYSFYEEVPGIVEFTVSGGTVESVFRSEYLEPDYYSEKIFKKVIIRSEKGVTELDASAFEAVKYSAEELYPNTFLLIVNHNGVEKELYVPLSVFNMSKYAGVEKATYDVQFVDNLKFESGLRQIAEMVEEFELGDFLDVKKTKNQNVYAKMKIVGTDTWMVWTVI